MENILPDGVPLERDYRVLIESAYFKTIEEFSNNFLLTNQGCLQSYINRWVKDPLHQCFRQWEYPFVLNRVNEIIKRNTRAKILDAGSGITFFPYYLNAQFSGTSIYCCDYDQMLKGIFEQVNRSIDRDVEFSVSDLRALPYENEGLDMVYCISVLEHTNDYGKIIDEFYRILRPNGKLVVTFDVSLDGTRDISIDRGVTLLSELAKRFDTDNKSSLDLRSQVSAHGVFTTHTAKDINANLLPWKYPSFIYRLKSFITRGQLGSWPPLLTVFCLCLTKGAR
jgi:SAM-dependent methyltransferase